MNIIHKNIIDKLHEFVQKYKIESLFLSGPYCLYLFDSTYEQNINQINVVSAIPGQNVILGKLFASEIIETTPICDKLNCKIKYQPTNTKDDAINICFVDYSDKTYMKNLEVTSYLKNNEIDINEPLINNLYGQDLTIYSLAYSLYVKKFFDPIHMADIDIKNEVIKSILPANILIKYNPEIILDILDIVIKHDFFVDYNLRNLMHNSINLLESTLIKSRIIDRIFIMIKTNEEKTVEQFKKYNIEKLLLDPLLTEKIKNA